ncbi:MAG TPA: DUF3021 family protein [Clostridia bacterium]|nr:DUF3021 family protein [Clostridia bacterium]
MEYFIITTCVTAAIGILGLSLDPTAKLGYEAYFSPLIFGLVSLVPSFITYSRKELSFRQALVRKALHVIVLEVMLLAFGFWAGILHGATDASFFGVTVFLVYLAVNFISWQIDKKDASEINKTLKLLQGRR